MAEYTSYFLKSGVKTVPHTLLGIKGVLVRIAGENGVWLQQMFVAYRDFKGDGGRFEICVCYDKGPPANTANHFSMRYDFNGVTGPLDIELAVKYWPELAHLIKWHLSSDGVPTYYIENTLYRGALGELELARKTALWLDAPEHLILGAPVKLEAALTARLPELQQQFREDLAATGLLLNS